MQKETKQQEEEPAAEQGRDESTDQCTDPREKMVSSGPWTRGTAGRQAVGRGRSHLSSTSFLVPATLLEEDELRWTDPLVHLPPLSLCVPSFYASLSPPPPPGRRRKPAAAQLGPLLP